MDRDFVGLGSVAKPDAGPGSCRFVGMGSADPRGAIARLSRQLAQQNDAFFPDEHGRREADSRLAKEIVAEFNLGMTGAGGDARFQVFEATSVERARRLSRQHRGAAAAGRHAARAARGVHHRSGLDRVFEYDPRRSGWAQSRPSSLRWRR
jgi:hypothetical protein